MRDDEKRAARAAYKERAPAAGIFAVRCLRTGEVWVGQSPNLGSVQNRLNFMLKFGNDDLSGLKAAWSAHGADNFAFEELEQLDDEDAIYVRDKLLKERLAYWVGKLGAIHLWR